MLIPGQSCHADVNLGHTICRTGTPGQTSDFVEPRDVVTDVPPIFDLAKVLNHPQQAQQIVCLSACAILQKTNKGIHTKLLYIIYVHADI